MQDAKDKAKEATESNTVVKLTKQVFTTIAEQNISGYAQMVAYNLLFATAPVLMVMVAGAAGITRAVNSDMQNPARPVLDWMQETLPPEAATFLTEPIERAMQADTGWILSVGALLALWGARGAVNAIVSGLNMSYGVGKDPRSFLQKSALSIGITLLLVLLVAFGGLVFALGTDVGEIAAAAIGLEGAWNRVSEFVRYPLMAAIAVLAVMILHRYGPAQRFPFKSYLPGSIFTIIAMYIVTLGLGYWFARSAGYTATYGIFGAVLAFILWLYIMGFVILIGGVINAVLRQHMAPVSPSQA